MATVKENLIAARALIDTPKKREKLTIDGALSVVAHDEAERMGARNALRKALPASYRGVLISMDREGTQRQIMALFDRAIAAQGSQP